MSLDNNKHNNKLDFPNSPSATDKKDLDQLLLVPTREPLRDFEQIILSKFISILLSPAKCQVLSHCLFRCADGAKQFLQIGIIGPLVWTSLMSRLNSLRA